MSPSSGRLTSSTQILPSCQMLLAIGGCGALFGTQWFQYQWPEGMDKANITRKELIPIILAVAIWGHEWSRKTIVAQCDNLAVVEVLNRGYSREPDIMLLPNTS